MQDIALNNNNNNNGWSSFLKEEQGERGLGVECKTREKFIIKC